MKAILATLVVVYLASFVFADDVAVLTTSNFDSFVNDNDLTLVEFYAPWCGHCKNLEPNYREAASQLLPSNIKLGKVDATVESSLGSRFGVSGYPTMKVFRKGAASEYKGPRDTAGIVSYMKKQSTPSVKNLETVEEVEAFINQPHQASFVGFFTNKGSETEKIFVNSANTHRDALRFGLVRSKAVLDHYGYKQAIVVFRPQDEVKSVYGGVETEEALGTWLQDRAIPIVGELHQDNQQLYKRKNLPTLKVWLDNVNWETSLKNTMYFVNRIKKVAKTSNLFEKMHFVVVNKKSNEQEVQEFGHANVAKDQAAVGILSASGQKFRMSDAFTVENLQAFVNNFLAGNLKSYVKSEPIPKENDGPVTVVVGETFNDIVMDPSKDVLLEVYAPWCGHCKHLEPVWNDLGKKMKKNYENVVIAKIDGTANDFPQDKFKANGFPSIFLAPAGDKSSPITYSGERKVGDFVDFLKKNGKKLKKKEKTEEL